MSFPSKEEREKCWSSRDVLWKCLDENNGDQEACLKFREMYISSCPTQWVKHFDRKREYLKFKDRIQKEGNCSPNSCNSINESSANVMMGGHDGKERIMALEATASLPDGITLKLVGSSNHLLSVNENQSSTSTSSMTSSTCNTAAIAKSPSPRIFRKFQPPTFS